MVISLQTYIFIYPFFFFCQGSVFLEKKLHLHGLILFNVRSFPNSCIKPLWTMVERAMPSVRGIGSSASSFKSPRREGTDALLGIHTPISTVRFTSIYSNRRVACCRMWDLEDQRETKQILRLPCNAVNCFRCLLHWKFISVLCWRSYSDLTLREAQCEKITTKVTK